MSDQGQRFGNSREAANYLGISAGHLRGLIRRGIGPAHERYGSKMVFWQSDLDAFRRASRVEAGEAVQN